MASQIAILATPEDLSEILTVASKLGARAVPEFIPADNPPKLHNAKTLFRANPAEKLYLLPGDLAAVEIFSIPGSDRPGGERVNDRTSPVVEVVPAQMHDRVMRSGRLYLGLSASDPRFRSAKLLYDALKRHTASWPKTKQYGVRVGPRAAKEARNHSLVLESNVGERLMLAESQ